MQAPQLCQQVSVSFSFLCFMSGNTEADKAYRGRQKKDVSILHDASDIVPRACAEASAGLCCLQVETDCFKEELMDSSVDVC